MTPHMPVFLFIAVTTRRYFKNNKMSEKCTDIRKCCVNCYKTARPTCARRSSAFSEGKDM